MDRLEKNTGLNEDGFVKAVFPFDEDQKGLLLNIIQYSVLVNINREPSRPILLSVFRRWYGTNHNEKERYAWQVDLRVRSH